MKYEGALTESLEDDLALRDEEEQQEVLSSFENILDNPNIHTERVKSWHGNIRKLRFGKFRLLMYVSEENLTVYALAYRPRDEVYRQQTQKEVERMVKFIEATIKQASGK